MKIAIYAICKNESKHIDRFVDACRGADQIVVVDTGSTDNSVELLRRRGVDLYEREIKPWAFDKARNYALSKVADDIDFCISIDLDEILQPNWRYELESAIVPGNNCAMHWHHDIISGNKYRECRTHSRQGWAWRNIVHEVLAPIGSKNCASSEMVIVHDPDTTKPRDIYLPLLDEALKDNPRDPRQRLQRAIERRKRGDLHQALEDIELAVTYSSSNSIISCERSYYCIIAANVAEQLDKGTGYTWLLRAVTYAPDWRDSWYSLARYYYQGGQYHDAYEAAERALLADITSYNYQSQDTKGPPLFLFAARAAYKAGKLPRAKSICNAAMKMFDGDEDCKRLYAKLALK